MRLRANYSIYISFILSWERTMIKPHGSDTLTPLFVKDEATRKQLEKEAESLPSIIVNSAAAANAVMLGAGYFTPLTGFMTAADAVSVADKMQTSRWPCSGLHRYLI